MLCQEDFNFIQNTLLNLDLLENRFYSQNLPFVIALLKMLVVIKFLMIVKILLGILFRLINKMIMKGKLQYSFFYKQLHFGGQR